MSDHSPKMRTMFGGKTSGGFFDLPLVPIGHLEGADIVIMGVPGATPYVSVGSYCSDAPDAIRHAFGWPGVLEHHDFDIDGKILVNEVTALDWGNLPYHEHDFAANRALITNHIKTVLNSGGIPLVLGGDDSIPIPVLQAYQDHGPLTILQIDAHIDWRDEVSGEKMGLSSNMRRASEMRWVKNIVQVGARGMGSARPQDRKDALDWGVQFFPMRDCIQHGFSSVIEAISQAIPKESHLYIALDIDAMDPTVVPSVIGPAPGGLTYWELITLLEGAAKRARIAGFSLTELMPSADIGGRGALVAARIVAMMLGMVARQRGSIPD